MRQNSDVVFSHKSDEWGTPQKLFDDLNEEFQFTLDPCATDENHKCSKYYTMQSSGLDHTWGGRQYMLIPHIHRLLNGAGKHMWNGSMGIQRSLCLCHPGLILDGFINMYMGKLKYVLLKGDYDLEMAKHQRHFRVCWSFTGKRKA